jgi:hypothetical protein
VISEGIVVVLEDSIQLLMGKITGFLSKRSRLAFWLVGYFFKDFEKVVTGPDF